MRQQEVRPVGPAEALAKFLGCAAITRARRGVAIALELVHAFERLPDVRRPTEALAAPEAAR